MKNTKIGMGIVVIILAGLATYQGGINLLSDSVSRGLQMLIQIIPLLILAFIIAGQISVLISEETISRWLGEGAGWKGPVLGALAGALVPGGPFFFYPLMATLIASGAQIGTLISFVAAKTLWSVGRIPVEFAFAGIELTLIRMIITFAFPILAGLMVNRYFPQFTDKVKQDVQELQSVKNEESRGDSND